MTGRSGGRSSQAEEAVRINLFGIPEIESEYGCTDATQYKSQQGWELITYLALVRKPVPSRQIAERLWSDQNVKDKTDEVRGIRYRFLKSLDYLKIGEILKLADNKTGYMINTDIPLSVDVWDFERLINEAKVTRDILKKLELLKKTVSLYRGTIYKEVSDKDWLMPYALEYDAMYEQAMMDLLETADKAKDYMSMHQYSLEALEHFPENAALYYWMMRSLAGIGSKGVMKKQMETIEKHLTEEEFTELQNKLGEDVDF